MLQPVNLQLAHFNVERAAQVSKDALAVVQQTGQGKEVAEESVRRTQTVQAGIAAAEPRKVKRRDEEEEREHRRQRQGQSFFARSDSRGDEAESPEVKEEVQVKQLPKSFEFYA